jgi:hypothetical protein
MAVLRRFWLRFAIAPGELGRYPSYAGLGLGCGVTAYCLGDAKTVLNEVLFRGDPFPEIEQVVEDVDVRDLDQGRVIPNMGSPHERGVWFPRL